MRMFTKLLFPLSLCSGLTQHFSAMSPAKKTPTIELASINNPHDIVAIAQQMTTKQLIALTKHHPQLWPILKQRHRDEGFLLIDAIKAIISKNADIQKVYTLIKNEAAVNLADDDGKTPLMLAAEGGNLEIVRLLIASGADPRRINNYWETAEDLARNNGYHVVGSYLARCTQSMDTQEQSSPEDEMLKKLLIPVDVTAAH
jgi:ankyrin repeat protein